MNFKNHKITISVVLVAVLAAGGFVLRDRAISGSTDPIQFNETHTVDGQYSIRFVELDEDATDLAMRTSERLEESYAPPQRETYMMLYSRIENLSGEDKLVAPIIFPIEIVDKETLQPLYETDECGYYLFEGGSDFIQSREFPSGSSLNFSNCADLARSDPARALIKIDMPSGRPGSFVPRYWNFPVQ